MTRSDSHRIRVLIADGTRMATELVADAINRDARFEIVESLAGSSDLMRITSDSRPDVILISGSADGDARKACDVVRELRSFAGSAKFVLLVDHLTHEVVVEAFRAGVRGIFSRASSIKGLYKCIEKVHEGQIWACSDAMAFVLEELGRAGAPMRAQGAALLSRREQEVVHSVAAGLSNREIAARLSLSEHTIKNYLFRIFDKLGVSNRAELIFCAFTSPAALPASPQFSPELPSNDAIEFERCQKASGSCACAQLTLGEMYRDGRGTKKDTVSSYMWFFLAELTSKHHSHLSSKARARLRSKLQPVEIAEAERRAAEWLRAREDIPPEPRRARAGLSPKGPAEASRLAA